MNGIDTRWRDHAIGALLCTVYVAILLATAGDLGMARDEGFYVSAAESYAQWFRILFDDTSRAFTTSVIDQYWRVNHEHPALIKSMFAWSWLAQQQWHIFTTDSLAFRFPGMLSAGLLLWLIYIFGAQVGGRCLGGFAAFAYALLPRPFYHSHLDCFDVPITLMITLVTYMYWRALTDRRFLLPLGVVYGLALATKHNAWITPGVLAIHFAFVVFFELRRRARSSNTAAKRVSISLVPWWILPMIVLGPAILIGSWPWMWHDTWHRLGAYATFHLKHDYYNMAYFGLNYFRPPFPMSYAWVMTAFTVPLTTLLLCIAGMSRLAFELFRSPIPSALLVATETPRNAATQINVLWLGSMFAPLAMITVPTTPIFGGTKHWFPAYPFLALFAGVGFVLLCDAIEAHVRMPSWISDRLSASRLNSVLCGACALLLLAPAAAETAHSHPFGLSHYTYLAGGVAGAADHGMNRQFWGFTTGSLTDYLKRKLPHGGSVYICDTAYEAFRMLWRDGKLPNNIRPTGDIALADIALVHHEHHFAEVEFQIWTAYGSAQPDHILAYDGVPIITVYENPRHKHMRRAAR